MTTRTRTAVPAPSTEPAYELLAAIVREMIGTDEQLSGDSQREADRARDALDRLVEVARTSETELADARRALIAAGVLLAAGRTFGDGASA